MEAFLYLKLFPKEGEPLWHHIQGSVSKWNILFIHSCVKTTVLWIGLKGPIHWVVSVSFPL